MKKNIYIQVAKSLLPMPLYFAISYLLANYLKNFDIVGPVGSNGKPIFSHYSELVFYGMITLIAIALIYSLFQAWKVTGWQKYVLIALIILLQPIQYIWLIAMQVAIFGK